MVKKSETFSKQKRNYLSQSDVPNCSLEEALRIPKAIAENYASKPTSPLRVASALEMSPKSGTFRMLCGASIAYGLTNGGYNANEISLESLGKRIVQPLEEGDALTAKREAILKPRILDEFIRKYSGSPLPRQDIAINVLVDMGVPREKAESVYRLILDSAQSVSFIRGIKDKQYIDLSGIPTDETEKGAKDEELGVEKAKKGMPQPDKFQPKPSARPSVSPLSTANRRVFITHGKNKTLIEPIKKLLEYGELIPIISIEKQSVSKPVPDKVMDDMRGCDAAIIHVDAEQTLLDKDENEHTIVNPNVLIEIGAAMALYGRRFILLVREGVQLPSNLLGLYEVRYKGDDLDSDATIRLLEAIKDIKNNPIPHRYKSQDENNK